jgi:hypothetical protein
MLLKTGLIAACLGVFSFAQVHTKNGPNPRLVWSCVGLCAGYSCPSGLCPILLFPVLLPSRAFGSASVMGYSSWFFTKCKFKIVKVSGLIFGGSVSAVECER